MRGPTKPHHGTFSIAGRSADAGDLGVAVSTAVPAVGSIVPHAEIGIGAIATQAQTEVTYGTKGLELLRLGLSPKTALDALLAEDESREVRQVSIVDAKGRTAAFTGSKTNDWKGHKASENHVVAGNLLVGPQVIEAMSEAFLRSGDALEERLMQALEAGQAAGGDKRGRQSAAILVAKGKPLMAWRPKIDLRVDDHADPVAELRRIFDAYKARMASAK